MARRRDDSLRARYPLCYAFGDEAKPLGHEAAVTADRDERIRSVWPFLVGRVLAFHETLRPRERANFDPEDVLSELWIEMAKKDHKWMPDRGKYITFAGTLADKFLYNLRNRTRTVESPRNSHSRLKDYAKSEADGSITPGRSKSASDIRRSMGGYGAVTPEHEPPWDGPDREPDTSESRTISRDAVAQAVRRLGPTEALVIGASYGLGGQPELTPVEIAKSTGRSLPAVHAASAGAHQKIRERLLAMQRPAAAGK